MGVQVPPSALEMYLFIVIFILLVAVFGIVIGAQNYSTLVDIKILNKTIKNVPLTLLIIECIIVGIVLAFIAAIYDRIVLSRKLREKEKEVRDLLEEVKALRMLPPESGSERESS